MIAISLALAVLGGWVLYRSHGNMDQAYTKQKVVSQISKGIFELNLLINDYHKHPINRALKQWHRKHQSLNGLLERNASLFAAESRLYHETMEKTDELKTVFLKFAGELAKRDNNVLFYDYNSRLLLYDSKLAMISLGMIQNAETLEGLIFQQLTESQKKSDAAVMVFILLFCLLILAFSMVVVFNVLRPVTALTKSAAEIGKGNLDNGIALSKKDEIGFLAMTFNEMRLQLKRIMVHRSQLESEIAERQLAEEKIRESEELFKAVFEQAGGYCMVLEPTEDGIPLIWDANEAACRAHGYTKAEMIGRPVADLDDEEGKRRCRERTAIILSGQTLVIENMHVRKDGSSFPVAVHANTVFFDNRPPLIVTTEFDLSEIKAAEAKKKSLERQLQQAQKMESIGTLAGGIAHDFNNILSAILGFSEIALGQVQKGSLLEDDIKEIYAGGLRAKKLVKQILTFARQSDEQQHSLNVNPIIKEALKFIRSSTPANIEITAHIDASFRIMGSPTQVHQIMMNLCTNAAQAMEKGGEIVVVVSDFSAESKVFEQGRMIPPGNYLRIEVTDTGQGIPEEALASVFDPDFTTKAPGEGTGLGLAVVHGIVKQYKGEIIVQSEVMRGTTVIVYLPATRKKAQKERPREVIIPKGRESILFVDDEPTIVKMAKKYLSRLGYKVTIATSGPEALDMVRSGNPGFDLVITDMTMPKMTGDRLAQEMLKICPDLPVILCTGYSKNLDREAIKKIGIRALLGKPVEVPKMARTLRAVLDGLDLAEDEPYPLC